jgi:Protein of unknown function (DUF559)
MRVVGLSDDEIDHATASWRIFPVFRGVFAVGHRRIGASGRILAASLACRGAAASHRSAAYLLGLAETAPASVDVIAVGDHGRALDGIRPHVVPPPTSGELTVCDGVPCTRTARTLVDLAGMVGEKGLRRAVEQAAVLRTLDPTEVEASLARSRRRGAPILRSILADWRALPDKSPVLRSRLEARALALLERHGLPRPACNQIVDVGRRRLEVDLLWPGQKLVVELDGGRFHGHRAAIARDKARDRDLLLAGYRVMRFTWSDMDEEPRRLPDAVRRLLVR